MRLHKYINEAAIRVNSKDLKIISDTLKRKYKLFVKKKNRTPHDVFKLMQQAAKEITKKLGDVNFNFYTSDNPNRHGSASMGYPLHQLTIYFDTDSTFDNWNMDDDFIFTGWLLEIMEYVEHEMVHIEQYRRIGKEKDPKKAIEILGKMRTKNDQSYDRTTDAYLNYSLEIMAHAKSADAEIFNAFDNPREVIEMLKSDDGQDDISLESNSFNSYYEYIKDSYPKTWNKFIKYLMQYIERRIK